MYGYIYVTTNLVTGVKYIGQHKSDEWDSKYYGSGTILLNAIAKYGIENFSCLLLESVNDVPTVCYSKELLDNSEEFYIDYFNCVESSDFYNLKRGGEGGGAPGLIYIRRGTEYHKILPSLFSEYEKQGFVLGGPIPSEEVKKKRAKSNTGKKHLTAGKNISKALAGKPLSEEHKKSLRKPKTNKPKSMYPMMKDNVMIRVLEEDISRYEAEGWIRKSKSHSSEASKKHSQAVKGKIYVFESPETKIRIDPEQLDEYLAKGYKRRRKDFQL